MAINIKTFLKLKMRGGRGRGRGGDSRPIGVTKSLLAVRNEL